MSCIGQEKQKNNVEKRKMRQRVKQNRHQVTLSDLFQTLKNIVCPSSQSSQNCEDSTNKSPAKWKILDHAMGFLLEKEAYVSKLLALKEVYLADKTGPKSLEDVREQYRSLYSKHFSLHTGRRICRACIPYEGDQSSEVNSTDEETDELPQSMAIESSFSNIQEFEGETLELLLRSEVITQDQTGLSVVSEAISGLWRSLPPERKTEAQQRALHHRSVSWETQTEISASHLTSINPSSSYSIQEDLLEDAYDVVQRDMDKASVNRPKVLQSSDYEKLQKIYQDIFGFIRNHMDDSQKLPLLDRAEDLSQVAEYAEHLLHCSENFEDF